GGRRRGGRHRPHDRRGRLRGPLRHHHARGGAAARPCAHDRGEPPQGRLGARRAPRLPAGEGGQRARAAALRAVRILRAIPVLVSGPCGRQGMTEKRITELARVLGKACQRRRVWVATAESCTGGGVAEAITRIAGSSGWFECGFVTYSNAAKHDLLHVPREALERFGAVSEEVARE